MAKQEDADPLARARAAFEALEPKAPGTGRTSKRSAVEALYPVLVAARRDKGYTDNELVAMLTEYNIVITLGTFKQYMQQIAREQKDGSTANVPANTKERKASANANPQTSVMPNTTPKPTESEPKTPANPKPTGTNRGHKLSDNDL